MTRNARFKKSVRQYAAENGMTYQQAHSKLGSAARSPLSQQSPDSSAAVLGRSVDLVGDGDFRWPNPKVSEEIPFPRRPHQSPNILISSDYGAPSSMWSSLAASITDSSRMAGAPVVAVTPHPDYASDPELQWMKDDQRLQYATVGNVDAGYAEADHAAELITSQPSPAVFFVALSHPYPPVTEESRRQDFEANWEGTQHEHLWKPQALRTEPSWEDSDSNLIPLSTSEVAAYDRLLNAVANRLRQARSRGDVVIVSTSSLDGELRSPLDQSMFGLQLFPGLRFEYQRPLDIDRVIDAAFPGIRETLPPRFPSPFWWGMNPKNSRIVLAADLHEDPSGRTPEVVLLKDPPLVPDYWSVTYEMLCGD